MLSLHCCNDLQLDRDLENCHGPHLSRVQSPVLL